MQRVGNRRIDLGARPLVTALTIGVLVLTANPGAAQFGAIGLSGVGAQRFANENLPPFAPQTGDHFGAAYASGDFNGDGAADLATGVPQDNGRFGSEINDCGAVVVRYGAPGAGFAAGPAQRVLSPTADGAPDPAETGDGFGQALAACDFNGDGFDDLAVGVPFENDAANADAGAVEIFLGSATGLATVSAQRFTQDTAGVPEAAEPSDRFGFSLACGDFAHDGFADLAIGIPLETIATGAGAGRAPAGIGMAGALVALRGSPSGLATTGAILLHQDSAGMPDASESFDLFAWALATGDFNGDGFDDLAIGVPGEDNSNADDGRGAIQVVFGGAAGLTAAGSLYRTEATLGGDSELGDELGLALAAGDFDGDGHDDLAVGIPFEDLNLATAIDAGMIAVLYGAASGFDAGRTQFWYEDIIHFPGATETDDRFGSALASGDFDADGYADLAIGEPGELLNVAEDGMVTVVMGSPGGISALRRHGLAAGFHGNPGVANQPFRNYGAALASGDFDGDGNADLAIGAPNENEAAVDEVGATVVFYGSLFSDGLEVQNTGFWSAAVP